MSTDDPLYSFVSPRMICGPLWMDQIATHHAMYDTRMYDMHLVYSTYATTAAVVFVFQLFYDAYLTDFLIIWLDWYVRTYACTFSSLRYVHMIRRILPLQFLEPVVL